MIISMSELWGVAKIKLRKSGEAGSQKVLGCKVRRLGLYSVSNKAAQRGLRTKW